MLTAWCILIGLASGLGVGVLLWGYRLRPLLLTAAFGVAGSIAAILIWHAFGLQ